MSGIKDSEQLEDLRERLYARGATIDDLPTTTRHQLTKEEAALPKDWGEQENESAPVGDTTDVRKAMPRAPEGTREEAPAEIVTDEPAVARPRRTYRLVIVGLSLFLFIIVASLSSVYLFYGGNQISGTNIEVALTGPFSVSGGETLPIQVGVTNQNSVPIESVVLILSYPDGSRSVGDDSRDLYEERISLEDIGPGETLNIPVRIALFGEESETKDVNAKIEYRLQNSNGIFYKEANVYSVQLQSAALVIGVKSVEKVASGQEFDIVLNVRSNSQAPLTDVLVSADYPDAFDFSSASPEPIYGQNTWLIERLEPEEVSTITLRGVLAGLVEEEAVVKFQAGTPQTDNQFIMGTVLATGNADFIIERPFIDVDLRISSMEDNAVLAYGRSPLISVELQNTLNDPIYDMAVEVSVGGNVLDERAVEVRDGFYNSIKDVVRWDVTSMPALGDVPPGATRRVSFAIEPNALGNRAYMEVEANVFARRVLDNQVSEELIGSAAADVKFTSSIELTNQAGRNTSGFADSGPIPPVAEETTTYTITLAAEAGANDVVDTVVTTSLPQYVEWLNKIEGDGSFEFNPVTKHITWDVGDIGAEERATASFQVALTPSLNQIGDILALVGSQELRAIDRFTDEVIRSSGSIITTEMSEELGYQEYNGEVIAPEDR